MVSILFHASCPHSLVWTGSQRSGVWLHHNMGSRQRETKVWVLGKHWQETQTTRSFNSTGSYEVRQQERQFGEQSLESSPRPWDPGLGFKGPCGQACGQREPIQARSTHPLNVHLMNDSYVSCTLFLHKLTVCLFYYIEETRHSLRVRGLEIEDGLGWGKITITVRQAGTGSNPSPSWCYFEVLLPLVGLSSLLRCALWGAIVKITDDTGTIPDRVTLTEQTLSIL